ncbi:glycosyltransferase family 4 protein [Acidobacteriota bacterium]
MGDSSGTMKIAMLAPVSWPVPPESYGPWEQVVANLTEALVKRGHEVSLFAASGSATSAKLIETVPHPFSLWPGEELKRPQQLDPGTGLLAGPPHFRALEQQHIATCMEAAREGEFDIIHSHLHVHALVFSRLVPCPMITTLHGSAWVQADHVILSRYKNQPFVSISDSERAFKPDLNYVATVYNGINADMYEYCEVKEDFLLFSGRIAPEKGAAEAVQIALKSGRPLKMAGVIEEKYRDYYETTIQPYIDGKNVEYLGLLSQRDLVPFYQKAKGLLCPIHWAEPFGLVVVEAQACGTPVLGARKGAFVEIIQEEKTGFLFDDVDEAVRLVQRLDEIEPIACRQNVEHRFTAAVMADAYEKVYRTLLKRSDDVPGNIHPGC